MPKAPAGAQRSVNRMRLAHKSRATSASRFHRRSLEIARAIVARVSDVASTHEHGGDDVTAHRSMVVSQAASTATEPSAITSSPIGGWTGRVQRTRAQLTSERAVPVGVALVLLAASVFSYAPSVAPVAAQGGTTELGEEPRIAIGGSGETGFEPVGGYSDESYAPIELAGLLGGRAETDLDGPGPLAEADGYVDAAFLEDGTLLKPVAVDTSIADASELLTEYRVQSGDTLVGIASKHDVSMMTVWWANKLASKDDLKVGQILVIPPVSGLVVTVAEGDTMESIASKNGIEAIDIMAVNGLEDPTLVIGQTIILPDALGEGIATPKPTKAQTRVVSSGGSVRPPTIYKGGAFAWPVVGGNNYISQYYRYGHYGIDIAATYGSKVRAAASGTVQFAGWRSNGGGYQVWIAHGSGLYSTYNHMSAVTVGAGQKVGKGQQVGRIGSSGYATGPHLHFEVWKGAIWNGGSRVNPLRYY